MRKYSVLNPELGCIELSYTSVIRCAWCESTAISFDDPVSYPVTCVRAKIPGLSLNASHVCPMCRRNLYSRQRPHHTSFDVLKVEWSRRKVDISKGFVPPKWAAHYLACILSSCWDSQGSELPNLSHVVTTLTIRRGYKVKRRQSAGRKGGGGSV